MNASHTPALKFPERLQSFFKWLAGMEIWIVILLVLVSMVQERWLPWAVVGIGLASLLRWLGDGHWSLRTPVDIPVAILAGMALVSLWITPLPEITNLQVCRLFVGLGLFYSVVNWAQEHRNQAWLAVGIVLATSGLSALAVVSVRWPIHKLPFIPAEAYTDLVQRIGDTIHPNVLAGNLSMLMPFGVGLFLFPWDAGKLKPIYRLLLRVLLAIGLLGSTAVLVLTQSRGSWLAFAAACALILMLRFRWGWLALLISGMAGAGAAYKLLDIPLLLRWLRSSFLVGELSGRIELWARAIFMIEDFSFTGIGMGTYPQTADALYPLRGAAPPHAHNLFLQVGVDLGMPGLLAWLAIWLLVTLAAWNLWRVQAGHSTGASPQDAWVRGAGAGLLGCQVALTVHGLFDAVTWGMIRPAPLVWLLWGVSIGVYIWQSRRLR